MLLFNSEAFQQQVLQESLDTIRGNPSRFPCIGRIAWPRPTTKEARSHQESCSFHLTNSSQKRARRRTCSVSRERYGSESTHSGVVQWTKKHWPLGDHGHRRNDSVQCLWRTQCKKRTVVLQMWSTSVGIISRKGEKVERNNGARQDSLERFAVPNLEKRSDTAPQSSR